MARRDDSRISGFFDLLDVAEEGWQILAAVGGAIGALMLGIGGVVNPSDPRDGLATFLALLVMGSVLYAVIRLYRFNYKSALGRIVGVLIGSVGTALFAVSLEEGLVNGIGRVTGLYEFPQPLMLTREGFFSIGFQALGLAVTRWWRSPSGMSVGLFAVGLGFLVMLAMPVLARQSERQQPADWCMQEIALAKSRVGSGDSATWLNYLNPDYGRRCRNELIAEVARERDECQRSPTCDILRIPAEDDARNWGGR